MERSEYANDAAAAHAFLKMYLEDQEAGREPDVEDYKTLFPGHEEVVAREWSRMKDPDATEKWTELEIPGELLPQDPGQWRELLERIRSRTLDDARFLDRGEVARGGMGVVERLFDSDLRRVLAMKICTVDDAESGSGPSGTTSTKSIGRFLEEAQVTAQLEHPGIVPVHDLGVDDSGHPYFTMRLVKGLNLRDVFALVLEGREEWTQTRALGVLMKACEAMAYAHDKGVVHRDLKPANIMVGKFGEVYVMDWGLAKVRGRTDTRSFKGADEDGSERSMETLRRDERTESPDSSLVTMDGDVLGTPAFMSPEQARGEVEKINPRSDVYAMGAILYQLLTGRSPYALPGTPRSPRTILALLQEGAPNPLSEMAPDSPPQLAAICEKAMSREETGRYADMIEFARDLRAYLEGRVVQAYETGALAEMKSWVRRNRALSTTIAASVLIVVLGSMGYAWKIDKERTRALVARDEAETARDEAEEAKVEAETARDEADQVAHFLTSLFLAPDPERSKRGSLSAEDLLDVGANALRTGSKLPWKSLDTPFTTSQEASELAPAVRSRLMQAIGGSFRSLGEHQKAEELLLEAVKVRRENFGEDHETTLQMENALTLIYVEQGRMSEALELRESVWKRSRDRYGKNNSFTCAYASGLGDLYRLLGRNEEAEPLLWEALEGFLVELSEEDYAVLRTRRNLGLSLQELGRADEAEEQLRMAFDGFRLRFGEDHPRTLDLMQILSVTHARRGEHEEGLALAKRALDLARGRMGEDHPDLLIHLNTVAGMHMQTGMFEDALAIYEDMVEKVERQLGPDHLNASKFRANLATTLMLLGRNEEAEPVMRKARLELTRALGETSPHTLIMMLRHAELLWSLGQAEEAETLLESFLEVAPATFPAVERARRLQEEIRAAADGS